MNGIHPRGVNRVMALFRQVHQGPHHVFVEEWEASGAPVVGVFCAYAPPEVIWAAGALPIRLRGAGSLDSAMADTYMTGRTCTFVRHVMSLALDGRYDFLEGEVSLNTCDHVRRACDLWRLKTPLRFHGFISLPRDARESLYSYYRDEVRTLGESLAEHLGTTLSKNKLKQACALYNKVRKLVSRVDQLRARRRPLLSGADALTVAVASQVMPPERFCALAEQLLEAAEAARPRGPVPRARLLLAGGELDEPEFVAALERQGAVVAADTLCFGSRNAAEPVRRYGSDPLDAICRRTFFQTSCARMMGSFPDRVEDLLERCRQRDIDGVVFQRLKFCDPWGSDAHNLRHRLRDLGVPLLLLEREYGMAHAGQVSTRVQAFMELIESSARRGRKGAGETRPVEAQV